MDLLATVRKEGSRGGRGDFKWSDVESSSHRENYLGHSLMAPVGRWQKGRDLGWYAKGESATDDKEDPAEAEARQRREEIKRIKEAEQDALARALGLPVAPRTDANAEPVRAREDIERLLHDTGSGADGDNVKGLGFGALGSLLNTKRDTETSPAERLEGNAEEQDKELQYALKEYNRRYHHRRRSRSRSRSRQRDRDHHRRRSRDKITHDRRRSRSREQYSRRRSRSRSNSYAEGDDRRKRHRDRSRSPFRRHEGRRERADDRRRKR